MTLTITIDLDNAVFEVDPGYEAAAILRAVADNIVASPQLRPGMVLTPPMDSNGNTVGTVKVAP